jgi:hypothetical protein
MELEYLKFEWICKKLLIFLEVGNNMDIFQNVANVC